MSWSGTVIVVPGGMDVALIISGVAAVMLSANPKLMPKEVRQILIETAEPLASLQGK